MNIKQELSKLLDSIQYASQEGFREAAGKDYDPSNGTAQLDPLNAAAALAYGRINVCETLREELKL